MVKWLLGYAELFVIAKLHWILLLGYAEWSVVAKLHWIVLLGYAELPIDQLEEALMTCLHAYNQVAPRKLEIIFFRDVIDHVCRLVRVLVSSFHPQRFSFIRCRVFEFDHFTTLESGFGALGISYGTIMWNYHVYIILPYMYHWRYIRSYNELWTVYTFWQLTCGVVSLTFDHLISVVIYRG